MSDIPLHMLRARAEIAQKFIAGSGIEIGALHNPLSIGPEVRVKYVDKLSIAGLREHYPELHDRVFVEPDIIDDGEILSSVQDNSLDFIIANHMLEHCENPLGAIRNHLRKVHLEGILYYAIPEKEQGFDAARESTSFLHLVEDDLWGPEVSRHRHFWEWVTFVNQTCNLKEAAAQVEELKKRNYSIHFHVWDERSFREFTKEVQRYLHDPFHVVYLERNDTEVITVFRKMGPGRPNIPGNIRDARQTRSYFHILFDQVEATRKAHAEEQDRLEAELRRALKEREAEIHQARHTIDGLVEEIHQARRNIHTLSDEIEMARKAHAERDRLEAELKEALAAREGEIIQARNTIDQLVGEIDQARDNIHDLTAQVERARKAHAERDRVEAELRQALRAQDERFEELTAQLDTLTHDLKLIRESW
jgi:predicted SAM-dependent methyltransferase